MTSISQPLTATSLTRKKMSNEDTVEQFQRFKISTPKFGHKEHVEIAYEMLCKYEFVDACARYARTIRAIAVQHGAAEKYNATLTFAFMSVIAERKSLMEGGDLEQFLADNPDLLDKNVLMNWYSEERLTSAKARVQFLLPDRASA